MFGERGYGGGDRERTCKNRAHKNAIIFLCLISKNCELCFFALLRSFAMCFSSRLAVFYFIDSTHPTSGRLCYQNVRFKSNTRIQTTPHACLFMAFLNVFETGENYSAKHIRIFSTRKLRKYEQFSIFLI